MTLNLYTYKPSSDVVCSDELDVCIIYIQGIMESIYDITKDKLSCFLELKREQNCVIKKLKHDLLNHIEGNYYKNHILLDLLNLHNMYNEEFNNDTSGFDIEIINIHTETTMYIFELFSCATNINVYVKSGVDKENVILQMLYALSEKNLITIISSVELL